jgi:hypothetical protein
MAALVMLRGVDWPAFGSLTVAGAAVGTTGIALGIQSLMLLVVSSTLLAAGAAFVLDDPASSVTDVTATRSRQTWVRAQLLVLPMLISSVLIGLAPANFGVPRPNLLVASSGALVLSFTAARLMRKRSSAPGIYAATAGIALTLMPAVLGHLSPVETFPGTGGPGVLLSSDAWWAISDAGCALLLCSALLAGRGAACARRLRTG